MKEGGRREQRDTLKDECKNARNGRAIQRTKERRAQEEN
jgi:hypothetical protein